MGWPTKRQHEIEADARHRESMQRREDKAASYDKGIEMDKKEILINEFSKLLDYYGGVVDFEFNLGTFWWENEHGKIYTMIVQGLDE